MLIIHGLIYKHMSGVYSTYIRMHIIRPSIVNLLPSMIAKFDLHIHIFLLSNINHMIQMFLYKSHVTINTSYIGYCSRKIADFIVY